MIEVRRCPSCDAEIPADAPQGLCPKCLLQAGLASEADQSAAPSPVAGPSPGTGDAAIGPEGTPTVVTPPGGFVPPSIDELARRFPQLEILELVGRGGMGAVYKARQPGLDRLVALKVLPPEVGGDGTFAERFQREARALARLNHPHIVAVYDFGQAEGLYYFLMEYVEGATLRQVIGRRELTPAQALAIVPQICDALQYAHDEGIVHRDIKPDNILLDHKGRVKIADFGLAKLLSAGTVDRSLTLTHQVMGTLHYMAPEQLQGSSAVDHRADIYSLGVVFYELLTGELPLGRFAPPSKKVQIDVRLDEVVLRALEREPELRYQHASEVRTDIESIGAGAPSPVAPAAEPAQSPSQSLFRFLEGHLAWRWYLVVSVATIVFLASWASVRNEPVSAAAVGGFLLVLAGLAFLIWLIARTASPLGATRSRVRSFVHTVAGIALLVLAMPLVERLPLVEAIIWFRRSVTYSVPRDVKVTLQTRSGESPLVPVGVSPEWWFDGMPARLILLGEGAATVETEVPMPREAFRDMSLLLTIAPGRLLDFSPEFPSDVNSSGIYSTRGRFSIVNDSVAPTLQPTYYDRRAAEQFSLALFLWTLVFLHRTWLPTRRLLGLASLETGEPPHEPSATAHPERRYRRAGGFETDAQDSRESASATQVRETILDRRHESAHVKGTDDPEWKKAQSYVKAPASLLIVFAIVNVLALAALFMTSMEKASTLGPNESHGLYALTGLLLGLLIVNVPLSGVMWLGGARLWDLESWRLVRTAALLAMLPIHPGFPLGIVLGIWIFSVLSRPDVRRAFGQTAADETPHAVEDVGDVRSLLQRVGEAMILAASVALLTAIGIALWWWLSGEFDASATRYTHKGMIQWTFVGIAITHTLYAVFIGLAGYSLRRVRGRMFVLLCAILVGLLVPATLALNVIMEWGRIPPWPALLPLWLAAPVNLWAIAVLFRQDVRTHLAQPTPVRD